MGRLPLIRDARLDAVVRADRDVERFLGVPVEIPQEHAEGAVGVGVPPFVGRGDAGTALALRIQRQRFLRRLRPGGNHPRRDEAEAGGDHRTAVADVAVCTHYG